MMFTYPTPYPRTRPPSASRALCNPCSIRTRNAALRCSRSRRRWIHRGCTISSLRYSTRREWSQSRWSSPPSTSTTSHSSRGYRSALQTWEGSSSVRWCSRISLLTIEPSPRQLSPRRRESTSTCWARSWTSFAMEFSLGCSWIRRNTSRGSRTWPDLIKEELPRK